MFVKKELFHIFFMYFDAYLDEQFYSQSLSAFELYQIQS